MSNPSSSDPPRAVSPDASHNACSDPPPDPSSDPAPDLSSDPSSAARKILRGWPDRADALAADFSRYIGFLLSENRKFNLTGDPEPGRQWRAHIEDALLAAREVERFLGSRERSPASMRVVDVGSGAGMPGLVWAKLWPGAEVALVESNAKKCRFLERAAEALGAQNVIVVEGRAEDLARLAEHRERFDLAVARGLAKLRILAEWTLPFVRPGGYVLAIKGGGIEEEIAASGVAFETLGGERNPQLLLPYTRSDGKRCQVVVCEKLRPTPEDYPRRAGAARKRPL